MRQIDVQDQFRMGVARTFGLTVSGIRYRLFRSSVTVVVISVAIAFLMNVLSEGLIMGAVGRMTRRSIRAERLCPRWAARLSVPGTVGDIILEIAGSAPSVEREAPRRALVPPARLPADRPVAYPHAPARKPVVYPPRRAGGRPSDAAYVEGMRLGGLTQAEMRSYHEKAGAAARYVRYFENLDYAPRRVLVHNARAFAIFDRLHSPEEFGAFRRELAGLKTLKFPTPTSEFRAFLDEWPALRETTLRIQQGRAVAQARVKASLGSRTVMEGLAEMEGLAGAFGEVIREAGFALSEPEASALAVGARRILDMRHLEGTVLRPEMRRAVAAYVNVMPAEVNAGTLWKLLAGRGSARWYYEKLADKGAPTAGITLARARDLARRKARLSALTAAERSSSGAGGGFMGIGERMTWLVAVAMLVCVVGVANAMLMSVTERFREIATLKCLGALDGSIMLMYVMEAGLLGAAGGVTGAIAGSVIGFGRMLAVFGGVMFLGLPASELLAAIIISGASGVILAGAAALYPSWTAARLAPMEAMRIQ